MHVQEPFQQPLGGVGATFLEEDDLPHHTVSQLQCWQP